jgi:glycine dehydrogenase subunit 2
VGVGPRLLPHLPLPVVGRDREAYRWLEERDLPQSIGRLTGFMGNAGVLLRAYVYMRMLGREGMSRVGEFATLNSNYLSKRLQQAGFTAAYPGRRASHEFILTLKELAAQQGVTAMDVAKRLLDFGFHAPTTYFPLLVPECLLIEPTETESRETLDAFVGAMSEILAEAQREPEMLRKAPFRMPVRRLDDVRAARELDLAFRPGAATATANPAAAPVAG